MMTTIGIFNNKVFFDCQTELEKYRVNSLLDKEGETIAWIDRWDSSKEFCFFDIGSNIGIYSIYAWYKKPLGTVYSFEPVLDNYIALERNVRLNNTTNIIPFRIAISSENKLENLYLTDKRVANSGAQIGSPIGESGIRFEPIRIEKVLSMSVDNLVFNTNFPIPDYIKIDVDGHETKILQGMSQVLKSTVLRSILVEFNNGDEFAFWEIELGKHGFVLDKSFDDIPNHSMNRRLAKGSLARNYIFIKIGD